MIAVGAIEHLRKPIDRDSLVKALERRNLVSTVRVRPVYVLAIDDDPQQLELIRAELEPRGFDVRTAIDGKSGLVAAREGNVDLILLDLRLPDISGFDVAATLKRDPQTADIPIILITAHEITHARAHLVDADMERSITTRTIAADELHVEISRILRSHLLAS